MTLYKPSDLAATYFVGNASEDGRQHASLPLKSRLSRKRSALSARISASTIAMTLLFSSGLMTLKTAAIAQNAAPPTTTELETQTPAPSAGEAAKGEEAEDQAAKKRGTEVWLQQEEHGITPTAKRKAHLSLRIT